MNSWSSNCNTAHMANNLMRWWRTKFLNSYKSFTVECNEGRVSDTEELLGRNPEYQTSCTTPPLQNQTTHSPSPLPTVDQESAQQPTPTPHPHLNLQEFSCDVSVEGGPDKSTQERQEFSFTLYDFDGHGKITKDDIAGLVTTIYEVLGSSVKVPHYGSKTIKVKLTVSPDQRKHVSATVIGHKNNKFDEQNNKTNPNSNNTVKQSNNEKRRQNRMRRKTAYERKHYCCRKLDEEHDGAADVSEDYSDVCSRVSADITTEDEEGEYFENRRSKGTCQKRYQKHSTSRYTTPNRFTRETSTVNQKDNFLKSKKVKKRSSSLQRQELLEIIQSNMDKNNSSFQMTRKPYVDHISIESTQLVQNEQKQRHRHKGTHVPTVPLQYFTSVVDPTHFYVDLASLQNTTQLSQNNCHYDKLVDAVMRVSNNKKLSENKIDSFKKHVRSKSYDLSNTPLQYQVLEPQVINTENINKSTRKQAHKLTDFEPTAAVKRNIRKFPQVVVGHTSSPHHLRHRNRQEDQARAMAQVVRWLEQEFSSNLNTKDSREKTQSNSWTGNQDKHSCNMPPSPNSSSVERHEHHHVHEHIHHHYHHYHSEAPFVV